ncbi:MAG: AraC family transcriptional regulator [Verrucomicrobiota bacterium]
MPLEPNYFSAQVSDAHRFYLELNPGARRQITVISGGWERCRSDYDMHRAGFSSPIIEFVARGVGTLTLEGKLYELRPGTIFVYGEGTAHQIRTSPDHAMEKYFVAFEGGAELLRECQIFPGAVLQATHPAQIHAVFDDLTAHGRSDHANRARMCQIALQYLIMKIADNAVPYGPANTAAVATYQRCRQFIEEHYLRVHTLAEVAAACHVDSAYLCRLFKRFRRQTPFQYLQNLKMNRAVELLQDGACSVKQTAQELGFSDPYNFSRAFKRVFGIAPRHMHMEGARNQ